MNLNNLVVSVLGAGRSGRAAAVLAASRGARVTIYDGSANATFEGLPAGIQGVAGIAVADAAEVKSDLVVVSPGIETAGEFVRAFTQHAQELIGETELGYRFYGGHIIGITGTNGKTTTTEIVEAILNAADISCRACGNYGVPLSEVVMDADQPEAVALELSSFQLETIVDFRPDVAVWLNFAADHMDRYPDLASYKSAKARIFENMTPDDLVVMRDGEDPDCEIDSQRETFSRDNNSATYRLAGQKVIGPEGKVVDLTQTRLRGLHNAENVMAAAAATKKLGVIAEQVQIALADYSPPAHRCEYVATIDGVEYINDSKATNLHALESALSAFDQPMILIVGGKQKNLDYSSLAPVVANKTVAVICFGEIAESLAQTFSTARDVNKVETLQQAVTIAHRLAKAGQLVLLSPGTSSFDQFSSYEARGDAFCSAVAALSKSHFSPPS